ncbi:protein mono-ADP-ribosyltransferase TIPARP-like [Carettochelys insculpta]|uniref:protein mono-ADP-ribosyltransferase TIPARP-like n=1 Tax=Carettochelys insculpta TaxID=44489 RepID=UPI003EB9A04F
MALHKEETPGLMQRQRFWVQNAAQPCCPEGKLKEKAKAEGLLLMAEKPKRPRLGLAQCPLLLTLEPQALGLGGQVLELAGPEEVHVHQKDGIQICDNFLLGQCLQGERCPRHHTPKPFHWQMRRQADGVWLSVGTAAQQHLEKLYCSLSHHEVQLRDKYGSSWTLNLDTMKLNPFQRYDRVRRLSNTSNPSCNPYFPSEWRVYWEEWVQGQSVWLVYEEPMQWELLAAFEKGMWNHAFKLHGRLYNVDLKRLTQSNVHTGFTRRILHRPIFRAPWYLAPHLRTGPGSTHSSLKAIPGEDPQDTYWGPYPASWVPKAPVGAMYTLAEVSPAERAYQATCQLFHTTLAEDKALVLAIYRVRNDYLWQKYCSQKKFMVWGRPRGMRCPRETHLFHGTPASKVQPICEMNFDPRVCGENGSAYGQGSYFATDASYSNTYAKLGQTGLCHMFLVKVLVGRSVRGNPAFRRPPPTRNGHLCDSCTDKAKQPRIFVIFDSCQCYPYFLIRYKLLSEPVAVDL